MLKSGKEVELIVTLISSLFCFFCYFLFICIWPEIGFVLWYLDFGYLKSKRKQGQRASQYVLWCCAELYLFVWIDYCWGFKGWTIVSSASLCGLLVILSYWYASIAIIRLSLRFVQLSLLLFSLFAFWWICHTYLVCRTIWIKTHNNKTIWDFTINSWTE